MFLNLIDCLKVAFFLEEWGSKKLVSDGCFFPPLMCRKTSDGQVQKPVGCIYKLYLNKAIKEPY